MKKDLRIIAIVSIAAMALGLVGCREKRISYVDMVKREKKEIQAYMDSAGITVRSEFPSDLVTPEGVFVSIPEVEGLYVRVVKKGDTSVLEDGKTIVVTRFNMRSISSRKAINWNLADSYSGGSQPLPFIYVKEYNAVSPNLHLDPGAVLETENKSLLCRALIEAVKIAGLNSQVEIITSFRSGPLFTSTDGIPVIFTHVTYQPKR